MKPCPPATGTPTPLAVATALSVALHALLFISWPQGKAGRDATVPLIPLEAPSGPACAPTLEGPPPALPPKPPEPSRGARSPNRHIATRKYLQRIRKKIEQNKFNASPPGASRMIGNAGIGFCITAAGTFEEISVLRSSGDPRLDETARIAVARTSGVLKRPKASGTGLIRTSVVIKYQYGL